MIARFSRGCRKIAVVAHATPIYKTECLVNAALYLGLAQNGNTLYNENKDAVK